jgi:predicted HAD superfamily Cof-like phosphohydrolase
MNWIADIAQMHNKFGVKAAVAEFDKDKLAKFLEFRIKFLQEELDEMKDAENADDVVDALIDLCIVAIGTLDAFNVNSIEAWDRVHAKNMEKEVGIKASRPNPLGLPDLIKPAGWTAPTHADNVGLLGQLFDPAPTQVEEVIEAPVVEEVEEASSTVSVEENTGA